MPASYTDIQFGALIHALLRAGPRHIAYEEALTEVARAHSCRFIIEVAELTNLCGTLAAAHALRTPNETERRYYAQGLAALCAAAGAPLPAGGDNPWLKLLQEAR